jgi:hypothetical protein
MTLKKFRWQALIIAVIIGGAAWALSSSQEAESTGPFFLDGVAEAAQSIPIGASDNHSLCRFRMTSSAGVASVRGTCYSTSEPNDPPAPPPPYDDMVIPINFYGRPNNAIGSGGIDHPTNAPGLLSTLTGTVDPDTGEVDITFSTCLGVDTPDGHTPADPQGEGDENADSGLNVSLTGDATKTGGLTNANATLEFHWAGDGNGGIGVCNDLDETVNQSLPNSDLGLSHDEDIWGDPTLGEVAPDGCTTAQELGTNQVAGGLRDPFNWWDFFDPSLDGSIAGTDFFAVLGRFGSSGDPTIDPTSTPPAAPAYHPRFDRGAGISGASGWNTNPANGSVAGTDFFTILGQFGHAC